MSIIEVAGLAKTFRSRERAAGLTSSLRSFVAPRYREREAVRQISFALDPGEVLAFWTEETQPFVFIFSRLTLVLGGVLAPLEIFPQPLRSIAQALPFSAILYGPARTLIHFELNSFVGLLIQQALTIVVGSVILLVIYQVAIRRVNINGG